VRLASRPDLDGVAAAQDRRRARGAGHGVVELPGGAGRAPRRAAAQVEHVELARPEIDGDEPGEQIFGVSGKQLQRLRHLDAGDHVHDGRDHARGVAGGAGARGRPLLEQAAQARRDLRTDEQRQAVGAHAGPVDPGNARAHADVVEQEPRLEVVGAVQDEVGAGEQGVRVVGDEVGHDPAHLDVRVQRAQVCFRRRRLGHSERDVRLVEERLALQVRLLDEVAVHHGQGGHARAHHHLGSDGAERAASHDHDARLLQARLPFAADAREELLPGVAGRGHDSPPGPGTAPPTS
jgi:hypothetical protein